MKTLIMVLLATLMGCSASAQDIKLPEPDRTGGKPLMQALSERRSSREYISGRELTTRQLSNLLWAANGFNRENKRTAPTGMDKQELELYVALPDAIYFYDAKNHTLKLVKGGDHRKDTGVQDFVETAAANILFVSDIDKAFAREHAYTSCGYVSQNIYLYCASEGLGTVARASFDGDKLAELIGLPSNQKVLLAQSVGVLE